MKKLLITILICSLFGSLSVHAEESFWYDEYFEYIDDNLNSFYYDLESNPSDSVKTFELYLLIIPLIRYQGTYPRTDGVDTYYDITLNNKDGYLCDEEDSIFDQNVRYIDYYLGKTSDKCVVIDRNHQFTRGEGVKLLTEILFPEVHDYKNFGHMNNFFSDSYLIFENKIMNHAELAKIATQIMKYNEVKKMQYAVQNFTGIQRNKFSKMYGNIFDMPQDKQYEILQKIKDGNNTNEYIDETPIITKNPVTPDDIVMNALNIFYCLKSGAFNLDGRIKLIDNINEIDINGSLNYIFNDKDRWDKENSVDLKLDGYVKNDKSTTFSGNAQFKSIYKNNNLYILLDEFDINNDIIKEYNLKPYIDTYLSLYKGKWMFFSDFPEIIKDIDNINNRNNIEYINMDEELRDLFMSTKFFNVKKYYGIEIINDVQLYHYELILDKKELNEYLKQSEVILGEQMLDSEIKYISEYADYLNNAEIWIGVDDFYPHKILMKFLREEDNESVDIEINGAFLSEYNIIAAPKEFGEFNIIELIEDTLLPKMNGSD